MEFSRLKSEVQISKSLSLGQNGTESIDHRRGRQFLLRLRKGLTEELECKLNLFQGLEGSRLMPKVLLKMFKPRVN